MDSINIKDIARICGVGVSTVSRAINNHPDINPETKNMIMQAIKEHNYIPNNSARNLKRTDSKAIAVLIKGISNPFFNKMIRVFEEEIQKKKYLFIMQRVDASEDEVDVALELIKEKKPRGIVFLGGFFSHSREKLEQLTVPFVLSTIGMTDSLEESSSYSWVSVDDYAESYKMTDYLCKLGHKKILILAATQDDESIGRLRLEGYKKALTDNGIEPDEELCVLYHGLRIYVYEPNSEGEKSGFYGGLRNIGQHRHRSLQGDYRVRREDSGRLFRGRIRRARYRSLLQSDADDHKTAGGGDGRKHYKDSV